MEIGILKEKVAFYAKKLFDVEVEARLCHKLTETCRAEKYLVRPDNSDHYIDLLSELHSARTTGSVASSTVVVDTLVGLLPISRLLASPYTV